MKYEVNSSRAGTSLRPALNPSAMYLTKERAIPDQQVGRVVELVPYLIGPPVSVILVRPAGHDRDHPARHGDQLLDAGPVAGDPRVEPVDVQVVDAAALGGDRRLLVHGQDALEHPDRLACRGGFPVGELDELLPRAEEQVDRVDAVLEQVGLPPQRGQRIGHRREPRFERPLLRRDQVPGALLGCGQVADLGRGLGAQRDHCRFRLFGGQARAGGCDQVGAGAVGGCGSAEAGGFLVQAGHLGERRGDGIVVLFAHLAAPSLRRARASSPHWPGLPGIRRRQARPQAKPTR
jgi:hypothetical protein